MEVKFSSHLISWRPPLAKMIIAEHYYIPPTAGKICKSWNALHVWMKICKSLHFRLFTRAWQIYRSIKKPDIFRAFSRISSRNSASEFFFSKLVTTCERVPSQQYYLVYALMWPWEVQLSTFTTLVITQTRRHVKCQNEMLWSTKPGLLTILDWKMRQLCKRVCSSLSRSAWYKSTDNDILECIHRILRGSHVTKTFIYQFPHDHHCLPQKMEAIFRATVPNPLNHDVHP